MEHIRVEALTVCVGYADFLAETAKYNAPLLDRWVIVTTPEDEATREVCRRYSLECALSRTCYRRGDDFGKGRMVSRGMHLLGSSGWRLHMDADIVLPSHFRHALVRAELNEEAIYGCDRIMVRTWQQWQKLLASGWLNHQADYHYRVNFPEGYSVGTRWANSREGWVPIGFLQLWHCGSDQWHGIRHRQYPVDHNDAARGDVQFGMLWDRRERVFLPEMVVAHLESEPCATGANWKGRKTKRFGPPLLALAATKGNEEYTV